MHYSHLLQETCNKLEPCFIEKYTLSISSKPDIPFYWASWHWQIPATDSTFKMSSSAEWCSQTLRQACCREKPESAMCVQNLNDSRGLAIRITYRISLRSSSLWEPRHPPLKVVLDLVFKGTLWASKTTKLFKLLVVTLFALDHGIRLVRYGVPVDWEQQPRRAHTKQLDGLFVRQNTWIRIRSVFLLTSK